MARRLRGREHLMAKKLDLTGERFGRLIVISPAPNKGKKTFWNCMCDCGKQTVASTCNLRRGDKVSCGCYALDYLAEKSANAVRNTRLYKCWSGIKGRCFNANSKAYAWYGARGITMCDEWARSFPAFKKWSVENGYSDSLEIDRIDNNGNYCPDNCRWVTHKVNCNNRRPRNSNCVCAENTEEG
jgi:hypothetical protein